MEERFRRNYSPDGTRMISGVVSVDVLFPDPSDNYHPNGLRRIITERDKSFIELNPLAELNFSISGINESGRISFERGPWSAVLGVTLKEVGQAIEFVSRDGSFVRYTHVEKRSGK